VIEIVNDDTYTDTDPLPCLILVREVKFPVGDKNMPIFSKFFVRDGIFSVADYNSSRMGVVVLVVVVVVLIFHDGIT
jgi:hypothetical protein